MPVWAKDLDGLEPDIANDNFYRWRNRSGQEIRTELENRAATYDGGAQDFGMDRLLTNEKLLDDIEDAVDGRDWFNGMSYTWASRNVTKYMMGGGGLDIYSFDELDGNAQFDILVKRTNKAIKKEIGSELEGINQSCESVFSDIYASMGQMRKNGFAMALGATQMLANVNASFSVDENGGMSFKGSISYTFYDTYDWGPARRNTGLKPIMGIADHWQFINLQAIGSEDFYSRAYFTSNFTGTFIDGELEINFSDEYQDSSNLSTHPEPQDNTNRLPTDVQTTYDGRNNE